MIYRLHILLFILATTLSGCSAQTIPNAMKPVVKTIGPYQLELSAPTTTGAGTTRWDLYLSRGNSVELIRLDSLVAREVYSSEAAALNGDIRKKAGIADAVIHNDYLYAMILFDRESSLRVYPVTAENMNRGVVYPAGEIGVGSFMNAGYAWLECAITPVSDNQLFIGRKGGTETSGGKLPMQHFDIQRKELSNVLFPASDYASVPNNLTGLASMDLTKEKSTIEQVLPAVLGLPSDNARVQILGVIDQSGDAFPRNDGMAYFFVSVSEGARDIQIVRYDFGAEAWLVGAYELAALQSSAMPWDR